MAESEHTHEVAEKTKEAGGTKTRVETTHDETRGSNETRVEVEGEARQIQPDGR